MQFSVYSDILLAKANLCVFGLCLLLTANTDDCFVHFSEMTCCNGMLKYSTFSTLIIQYNCGMCCLVRKHRHGPSVKHAMQKSCSLT